MRQIEILDTTLRDGEQTPGVRFSLSHKLEISKQLERLGVNAIEAGFPASSRARASMRFSPSWSMGERTSIFSWGTGVFLFSLTTSIPNLVKSPATP